MLLKKCFAFGVLFSIGFCSLWGQASKYPNFQTPAEKQGPNYSANYAQIDSFYKALDRASRNIKVEAFGSTDAGLPLIVVTVSKDKNPTFRGLDKINRPVVLVINAIHAGEPEGIDASMALARDLAFDAKFREGVLGNTVLVIIGAYNVGGVLNRGTSSRANQNGPSGYGFRGNGQNLDLNRDFMKCDSKNARSFAQLMKASDPDLLIDNHVSDGADYQHVLTWIDNFSNLMEPFGGYMREVYLHTLREKTSLMGFPMAPYVETLGETPETGIVNGAATPRFSGGYGGLFQVPTFTVETHMLKPFNQRLNATYAFMESALVTLKASAGDYLAARAKAKSTTGLPIPIQYKNDLTRPDSFLFMGYEAGYKSSLVSGESRLYYDRTKPYTKYIPWFRRSLVVKEVTAPMAYVIPQGWWRVIDILKVHGVEMQALETDQVLRVEVSHIDSFTKRSAVGYEGHHPYSAIYTSKTIREVKYRKGDLLVFTKGREAKYIVTALEAESLDGFLAWNFFDAILQQEEHYSDYVFEDIASQLLADDVELRESFEKFALANQNVKDKREVLLDWVYKHSSYYEPIHLNYPITRLLPSAGR